MVYSLNCKKCGKPLSVIEKMDNICHGTEEQKGKDICALNSPWFDYWDSVILDSVILDSVILDSVMERGKIDGYRIKREAILTGSDAEKKVLE